jgi:hypothetical protein
MDFDWKKAVSLVAPVLGTAVLGPLGPMAAGVITAALGIPKDSSDDQIAEAVKNATPEQLLALKAGDNQFKKDMRALDIKEDQLHAGDRDSARKRDAALGGDKTLKAIAVFTVVAFFVMIGFLLIKGNPVGMDKTILGMIIGYVVGLAQQVYNFLFGSSKGSHDKTMQLGRSK